MDAINRVLLVEGKSDSYVVSALLNFLGAEVKTKKQWNLSDKTAILELKGEGNVLVRLRVAGHGFSDLMRKLPTDSKASGLDSLAAIVDADNSFAERWNQIKRSLTIMGCANLPQDAAKDGLFLRIENGPRIGVPATRTESDS